MVLLIDAGNTRVKWSVTGSAVGSAQARAGDWIASGLVEHAQLSTLANAWAGLPFARVLVSNVAGPAMRSSLEQLLNALPGEARPVEWFASVPERGGVRNGYRNPAQLGCDRFASAIGAHALFPSQAVLVATCGTATTVDALSPDGVFVGGMILPGLGLMASSLARNTAQLPQIAADLQVADPFADHTDAAIASGCLAAQAGAIEHAVAALEQRHAKVQVILSGGAADLISPYLRAPHTRVDNLVLIGLQTVAVPPESSSC